MRAIVSVLGKDKKGIIAKVSNVLFEMGMNIEDISQTILQEYFTMIMMVDTTDASIPLENAASNLKKLGEEIGVEIRIQTEQIFNAMHKL